MGENKNMEEISKLFQNAPLAHINVKKRPNCDSLVSEQNKKRKVESNLQSTQVELFSPNTEKIIKCFSPKRRGQVRKLFKDDDNIVNFHNDGAHDLNYLNQLREIEWGKIMEYVICAHGHCPSCKSKLLLIRNPNFPVVDLKCSGELNKMCPLWYQVKVSIGSSSYFSKRHRNISVGSIRYGHVLHTTVYQPNDKIILGYICINLNNIVNETATINHRKSFVLVPNIKKSTGLPAYQYKTELGNFGKRVITWDTNQVQEYEIDNAISLPFSKIIKGEYDEIPYEK